MKTLKFSATIGIVAGYGGEQLLAEAAKVAPRAVEKAWQQAALKVSEETGTYVSATAHESRALYATAWGCPEGGEPTFTVEGSLNPQFGEPEAWKQAVLDVVKAVKDEFHQSTVTVEFWEVDQIYLQ